MKTLPEFKTGDTYALACTYKVNDAAVDLTGYTIASQLRSDTYVLISDTTVEIDADQVANAGKFTITASPADTSSWPTGNHLIDIEVSLGGVKKSSETVTQPVVRDVTQ